MRYTEIEIQTKKLRKFCYLPYLLAQYPADSPPIIPPTQKEDTVILQSNVSSPLVMYFPVLLYVVSL